MGAGMIYALIAFLFGLLGAVTFRIRGGVLEDLHLRGMLSRATWGLSSLIASGVGLVLSMGLAAIDWWWLPLAVGVLTYVSTMAGLHHTIDMGKNLDVEDKGEERVWVRFRRDFLVGHYHGLLLGSAVAVPLAYAYFGCWPYPVCQRGPFPMWWLPLVGGAAWGLVYALATWCWPNWTFLSRIKIGNVALGKYGNAPEGAEILFGFQFTIMVFYASMGVWP